MAEPSFWVELQLRDERLLVPVHRRARRTLALRVEPDGQVVAFAPLDADEAAVGKRIASRHRWIARHRRALRLLDASEPAPLYVSGADVRHLGRRYRLRVVQATEPPSAARVWLDGRFAYVAADTPADEAEVAAHLAAWRTAHARVVFEDLVAEWLPRLDPEGSVRRPTLRVAPMPRRWGSCTARGTITLSPALLAFPRRLVEYVVVHELLHLRHPHHGPAFFRDLDRLLPDWQPRQHALDRLAARG